MQTMTVKTATYIAKQSMGKGALPGHRPVDLKNLDEAILHA